MFSSYFLLPLAAVFVSAGLHPHPQPRIIGGRDMDIEEAPYMVSVILEGDSVCSGVIYSEWFIITAAHCFEDFSWRKGKIGRDTYPFPPYQKSLTISAGSSLRKKGSLYPVQWIWYDDNCFKSPMMTLQSVLHDIGIAKLRKPLRFSNKIQPIRLATKVPEIGSELLTAGWGYLIKSGWCLIVPMLQGTNVTLRPTAACEPNILDNNMLCAGTEAHTVCFQDSGGPLIFNNTLVGIVALPTNEYDLPMSRNCDGPGVFASVPKHRERLLWEMKYMTEHKKNRRPNPWDWICPDAWKPCC